MTKEELNKLFKRIMKCSKCYSKNNPMKDVQIRSLFSKGPWIYPTYNGVKGFFGTSKTMFICSKPSTGTFPSWKDRAFYNALKDQGYQNAHITDFIKCRGKAGKESYSEFENCYGYLKDEIKTLNPNKIIFVYSESNKEINRARKKLQKDLLDKKYRCQGFKIPHYSQWNMNEDDLKDWIIKKLQEKTPIKQEEN